MFSTIKKTFNHTPQVEDQVIIKVDPVWGFAEFPPPGEVKKHTIPTFIDEEEEEEAAKVDVEGVSPDEDPTDGDANFREYWMPDRLCKVCYSCEDPFTMFRRRHHCRMCGQVFCNQCSSYYIDGSLINMQGLVRCCKLCHEQMIERNEREMKQSRRKFPANYEGEHTHQSTEAAVANRTINLAHGGEDGTDRIHHIQILQNRASQHVEAIVDRLVTENITVNVAAWKSVIINLVREVVSAVDPNVREGDSIDIRNYVKLKIIPGGSMDENLYIDGVVFRKNVSHKKMMQESNKINPRILLLSGGIDFQRMDAKLSSMDTIIDQEDKYMQILVDKIMSFKPDIILVGKSVARRAQELLCNFKVVVMQNVKQDLLERIARMTRAKVLSSTDHMFQQFSQECLGSCGKFSLCIVHDDPEKAIPKSTQRILGTRIARGSTYAYLQGCPSEKGCSIILRGASRDALQEVQRILSFSIVVAYHLRLEVAYYIDRCAMIPNSVDETVYDDDSDDDTEQIMEISDDYINQNAPPLANPLDREHRLKKFHSLKVKRSRLLLSTSLDVDIRVPYSEEIRGLYNSAGLKQFFAKCSPFDHETLLVTSLLMTDNQQRDKADVKGIRYYTSHDLALGPFLIENCFNMQKNSNREMSMLDQTLSFIHRPGRIDITVSRSGEHPSSALESHHHAASFRRNPFNLPIYMSSYCKECRSVVTPDVQMSDETWKISFGKFMEIFLYNRSARCNTGNCSHSLRENHILMFSCEGYVAKFEFIPIHPFSLHMRTNMGFSERFHMHHTVKLLRYMPIQFGGLIDSFRKVVATLSVDIREVLAGRGDELQTLLQDLGNIETDIKSSEIAIIDAVTQTIMEVPKLIMNEIMGNDFEFSSNPKKTVAANGLSSLGDGPYAVNDGGIRPSYLLDSRSSTVSVLGLDEDFNKALVLTPGSKPGFKLRYPLQHKQEMFRRASEWNTKINAIAKYVDTVRDMILQQQKEQQAQNFQTHQGQTSVPLLAIAEDEDDDEVPIDDINLNQPGDTKYVDYTDVYNSSAIRKSELPTSWTENPKLHDSQAIQPIGIKSSMSTTKEIDIHVVHESEGTGILPAPDILDQIDELGMVSTPVATELDVPINVLSIQNVNPATTEFDSSSPIEYRATNISDPIGVKDGEGCIPVAVASVPLTSAVATLSNTILETRDTIKKSDHQSGIPISSRVSSDLTPYAKGALEHDKKLEVRPQIKANRITKALARFVMGKDNFAEDEKKPYEIYLGEIGEGRLALPNGKHGEVIAVNDDEPGTIIAYSLASEQYCDLLQEFMGEDYEEVESEDDDERGAKPVESLANAANASSGNTHQDTSSHLENKVIVKDSKMNSQSGDDYEVGVSFPIEAESETITGDVDMFYNDSESSAAPGRFSIIGRRASNVSKAFAASTTAPLSTVSSTPDNTAAFTAFTQSDNGEDQTLSSTFERDPNASAPSQGNELQDHDVSNKNENLLKIHLEKQMMSQRKSHIKHRFEDKDERGSATCTFQCQTYWATQFEALRSTYLSVEDNEQYIRSLATSNRWSAQGGKSGAAFSKSLDDRFVIKVISRVEMQMFLEFAPAYFEYMAKAFFHNLPTVLCKIMGVYTIGHRNRETGKKVVENVVVMENIFYQRRITRVFDLKGSSRARYTEVTGEKAASFDEALHKRRLARRRKMATSKRIDSSQVLLDDNLMELTKGRPFPLKSRSKIYFNKAVTNDTLFLSMVDVVDYSILVGFDEDTHEIVVGIIDYMRKYDIIKRMERVGKSVGMLTGQAEPTIIQPPQYRKRFASAMDKYFMTVPDKWLFDEF